MWTQWFEGPGGREHMKLGGESRGKNRGGNGVWFSNSWGGVSS